MQRSTFIALLGGLFLSAPRLIVETEAETPPPQPNLLKDPLKLGGRWAGWDPQDAFVVISRMRDVCLEGIRLVSDEQPRELRVDEQHSGPPHVWLHQQNPDLAWVVVDFAALHWIQLAYQFGHELGHVLCNSWVWEAELKPPCRWLEESMVEAFSIHGLGLLADSWEQDPPFPHNAGYANAIRQYRQNLIMAYSRGPDGKPVTDLAAWFHANRAALDGDHGLNKNQGPAIVAIQAEFARNKRYIEDMGALNRWPGRCGIPLEEYLAVWQISCAQLSAPGILPARLKVLLNVA
jgi:hypothetical protein